MRKRSLQILTLILALVFLTQSALLASAAGGGEESAESVSPVRAAERADADPTEPAPTEPVEPEPDPTAPTEPDEPAPTEPDEPEPTEPTEPTEPDEPEPTEPNPTEPEPEPVPGEVHAAYIHGDNVGAFRPESSLSRAELAQILFNTGVSAELAEERFPDVASDAWYAPAVNAICAAGLVDGYPDGTYRPDRAVSRAELVTILARLSAMQDAPEDGDAEEGDPSDGGAEDAPPSFLDVPDTHWASQAIALARVRGWVEGYEDGSFRPDAPVSRAEAVTLLNRFWGRIPDREAIDADPELRFFPDVDPAQWYYYDVMEASVSHTAHPAEDGEQWSDPIRESAGLDDGFRCVADRLYLVRGGDFVRAEEADCYEGVCYVCEGQSGVCTAEGEALTLFDGALILLTEQGAPLHSPGAYPEGFYLRGGGIYAAKNGCLVCSACSGTLRGCGFTCSGPEGLCEVEGPILPAAEGPWYRLSEGAVDPTPGLYVYLTGTYCVQEDGTLLQNGDFQGLHFGADCAYTCGNQRIDDEIDRIVGLSLTEEMEPEQMLFACYTYVFDNALKYRANNNHVPRGQDCSLWAETYMLRLMDQDGKGNCYCFAAEYYFLCRRIGWWQAKAVSGAVFNASYDHGWVEMELDGVRYLFDPRTDARYNKTPGALYMKTYDEAPYRYYPPD